MKATKLQNVIRSMENATIGMTTAIPLDRCADYIAWLDRFRKLPKVQIYFLADWMTALFGCNDDFFDSLDSEENQRMLTVLKAKKTL